MFILCLLASQLSSIEGRCSPNSIFDSFSTQHVVGANLTGSFWFDIPQESKTVNAFFFFLPALFSSNEIYITHYHSKRRLPSSFPPTWNRKTDCKTFYFNATHFLFLTSAVQTQVELVHLRSFFQPALPDVDRHLSNEERLVFNIWFSNIQVNNAVK